MRFEVFYASDGLVPAAGQALIIDQEVKFPPGRYQIRNCDITYNANGNRVHFKELDMDFKSEFYVNAGKSKAETPQVRIMRLRSKPPRQDKFVEVESVRPDDNLAPYEAMYRMMEKLYEGKTDDELDAARSNNLDTVNASEDDDVNMVVSSFGLLREEWDTPPVEEDIVDNRPIGHPPSDDSVQPEPEDSDNGNDDVHVGGD